MSEVYSEIDPSTIVVTEMIKSMDDFGLLAALNIESLLQLQEFLVNLDLLKRLQISPRDIQTLQEIALDSETLSILTHQGRIQ